MEQLIQIAHAAFRCRNFSETCAFYEQIMGLRKQFSLTFSEVFGDGVEHANEVRLVYYRINQNEFIELLNNEYENTEQSNGYGRIVFLRECIYDDIRRLLSMKVELRSGAEQGSKLLRCSEIEEYKELNSVFLNDPEGNLIEMK